MTTKRVWFDVHSAIGVLAGLMLFVICWSGTFATVSREIDWLLEPAMQVEPVGERASMGAVLRSVEVAYPEARISSVRIDRGSRSALEVAVNLPDQNLVRVFVDPYSAEVRGSASYFGVQRFFRSFHMNLFSGKPGYYLVFLLGPVLLVSVVAPLLFYKRWWTRFFLLRTGHGPRVFWGHVHKLAGLWSLWFGLLIALTASWYLFEGLRLDVGDGKVAWSDAGQYAVHPIPRLPDRLLEAEAIDRLILHAEATRPDLAIRTIFARDGYVYFDGQAAHWLVRDRANKLYIDPQSYAITLDQRASDQPLYWRWSDTADPLHFGDFGGLVTKLIWFAFGLCMSGLSLTGTYLHVMRLRSGGGGRERARWSGTLAAMIANVVVLIAAVNGGWKEINGYGPMGHGIRHMPAIPWQVAAFIIGWVFLTLVILAIWMWHVWRADRAAMSPTLQTSA